MLEAAGDARDRLYELGRRSWPGVEVDAARFSAYVRERAPDEAALAALHVADLYLACACAGGDARALAAFEQRYLAEVPLFLSGVERGPRVVDEVTQLVRERLFVGERSKILEYSGRGTLGSWVRVVTLRVASNGRRGRGAERHAPLDEANDAPAVLLAVDPELAIIKTRYKGEFNEALRAAFADLSPRDRLVFRMPSSTA